MNNIIIDLQYISVSKFNICILEFEKNYVEIIIYQISTKCISTIIYIIMWKT